MPNVTWRGVSGAWSAAADWQGLALPGSLDSAVFGAGDTSTATITGLDAIGGISFDHASAATLLVSGTLALGGVLVLAGGTLALAAGGTIEGGTVDLAGGSLVATGGVADGVTWLGGFGGGLVATVATALATQAALGGLAVQGALTLESGTYAGERFGAQTHAGGPAEIDALAHGQVTLGPGTTIDASADDPLRGAGVPPAFAGLTFGGSGTFTNAGLIVSDLSNVLAPLSITAFGFVNQGRIELDPATVPGVQQSFPVAGPPGSITVTYTQTFVPGLVLRGAAFENDGAITGSAATLVAQSATFVNTGSIVLGSARAQFPYSNGQTAYVQTLTVGSLIDITHAVTDFRNTGLIAADTIALDGDYTLAQLGTLHGTLLFAGTLDLGGGTLDVGALDPGHSVTFSGTVRDGLLVVDGGTLVTAGATLVDVVVRATPPITLLNVASGGGVLDANTTELAYTTAASVDGLHVAAGAVGTIDRIGARAAGTLRFGAATLVADTVAGSTLEIGGLGAFSDAGRIVLDGSELDIATLDGTGSVALADGAVLAVGSLAPGSAVTVAFGAGANLLRLPGSGASGVNLIGLTLTGLTSGDLIDFAGVSSQPVVGGTFGTGGAAMQGGTLYVTGASGEQARIAVPGSGAGLTFAVASDATGGTLVSVACFRHGTRLATPLGDVAVERLRIGDAVLTAGGAARAVKWLGRRRYPASVVAAQPQLRPVRIAAGALGHGQPRRALHLSPLHGVRLATPEGAAVLVPAAALLGCPGITRGAVAAVSYVHVELDTADLLLAEGAAAESFVDCDSRGLFDNAAEFAALYPHDPAPRWQFPLPRVEDGWRLHAIRARLLGRDGGVTARGARLRWAIDRDDASTIEGWALDEALPAVPLALALHDADGRVAWHVANRYRPDLDRAGLAACAFAIATPIGACRLTLRTLAGDVLLAH